MGGLRVFNTFSSLSVWSVRKAWWSRGWSKFVFLFANNRSLGSINGQVRRRLIKPLKRGSYALIVSQVRLQVCVRLNRLNCGFFACVVKLLVQVVWSLLLLPDLTLVFVLWLLLHLVQVVWSFKSLLFFKVYDWLAQDDHTVQQVFFLSLFCFFSHRLLRRRRLVQVNRSWRRLSVVLSCGWSYRMWQDIWLIDRVLMLVLTVIVLLLVMTQTIWHYWRYFKIDKSIINQIVAASRRWHSCLALLMMTTRLVSSEGETKTVLFLGLNQQDFEQLLLGICIQGLEVLN